MARMSNAYIKTAAGNITLKPGTSCPLNFGIADIRDIAKRGGTFSKQLVAPFNDENNRILGQLFDVNGTNFDFDVNQKTECEVMERSDVLVENAYLQLLDINETQDSNLNQDEGEYILIVKDAQRDLNTQMGSKELTDLDFTYLNHTYTSAEVVASYSYDYTNGYTYPMGMNDDNIFYLTDFRPAIYVKHYFDQIHATNGFSYEVQDWPTFNKLIIPFNGDEPVVDYTTYIVEATKSGFSSGGGTITNWTEILDDESIFNNVTGQYFPPVYVGPGQAVNCQVDIDFDLVLNNATGGQAWLVDILNSGPDRSVKYKGYFRVYVNGALQVSGQFINPVGWANEGYEFFESDSPIAVGDTTIVSGQSVQINIPISNLLPTDTVTFEIDSVETTGNWGYGWMKWKDANSSTANDVTITNRVDVNDVTMRLELTANTVGYNFEQNMNDYVPEKIKQKDFVKSICVMANLFPYPDPDNPNKIIYRPRDAYYDAGAEKDWSQKLAKDQNQLTRFLPEIVKKRMLFTYKPDKDPYNEVYTDATKKVYGQAEFIFDTEFRQGVEKKELIFSPTPMEDISIGAIVPSFIGSAPKTNIRILIHNGTATCNPYDIYDFATTGQTNQTTYPVCSHFDSHLNPTVDINFAVCDYYFYPGIILTNNNLFNDYWRRTMSQLNSGKMFIGMFRLEQKDIAALELNDKIWVKNAWWHINKVIDYDANANKLTKVELISADEEIALPPFPVKPYIPQLPDSEALAASKVMEQLYLVNNVNYSAGSLKIKGKGNVALPGLTGFVVGSDATIDESGYWYNGEKISEDDYPPPREYTVAVITSDYTIDCDLDEVLILNAASLTITLPDPDTCPNKMIWIKDQNQGGQTVTTAAGNIDTAASVKLSKNDAITVLAKNSKWNIM